MNNTASSQPSGPTCPACGATLPADAPLELCPKCLVREALRDDEPTDPADSPAAVHLGAFGAYDLLEELGHGGMVQRLDQLVRVQAAWGNRGTRTR